MIPFPYKAPVCHGLPGTVHRTDPVGCYTTHRPPASAVRSGLPTRTPSIHPTLLKLEHPLLGHDLVLCDLPAGIFGGNTASSPVNEISTAHLSKRIEYLLCSIRIGIGGSDQITPALALSHGSGSGGSYSKSPDSRRVARTAVGAALKEAM